MPPHVTMLLPSLEAGGMEGVTVEIVRGLADAWRRSVVCFDGLGPLRAALPDGVAVDLVPRRPGRDWGFARRLRRWIRDHDVDVLHVHNPTGLFYGALAVWGRSTRLIYTDHGRAQPLRARTCWAIRRVAGRVDLGVAVAPHLVADLVARQGLRPERARCIPNGVDVERFAATAVGGDASRSTVHIGTVGRLADGKEHRVLLEAAARLVHAGHDVRVDIVGEGPLRAGLAAEVRRFDIAGRVRLHGRGEDVAEWLRRFDVFVHASRAEGTPIAVLEAMASGLPVVVSDIPGHRAVIGDPPCGIPFPVGDAGALAGAIADLIDAPEHARRLAAAAQHRVADRFSRTAMVERYRDSYAELIAAR